MKKFIFTKIFSMKTFVIFIQLGQPIGSKWFPNYVEIISILRNLGVPLSRLTKLGPLPLLKSSIPGNVRSIQIQNLTVVHNHAMVNCPSWCCRLCVCQTGDNLQVSPSYIGKSSFHRDPNCDIDVDILHIFQLIHILHKLSTYLQQNMDN